MNRSKREDTVRVALVMSRRWEVAIEPYSIAAFIDVGEIDLSAMTTNELNAAGMWAMGEEQPTPVPPVPLMLYLGRLQRAHDSAAVM